MMIAHIFNTTLHLRRIEKPVSGSIGELPQIFATRARPARGYLQYEAGQVLLPSIIPNPYSLCVLCASAPLRDVFSNNITNNGSASNDQRRFVHQTAAKGEEVVSGFSHCLFPRPQRIRLFHQMHQISLHGYDGQAYRELSKYQSRLG